MSKTWTREAIIALLDTNDAAVGRALVQLAARQTADERVEENTKHRNGRGFQPCHARMGTSMAEAFKKYGRLTPKQVAYWRVKDANGSMRIGCYARQLLEEVKTAA